MREPETPEFPSGENTQTQVAMVIFAVMWRLCGRNEMGKCPGTRGKCRSVCCCWSLSRGFQATKSRGQVEVRPSVLTIRV